MKVRSKIQDANVHNEPLKSSAADKDFGKRTTGRRNGVRIAVERTEDQRDENGRKRRKRYREGRQVGRKVEGDVLKKELKQTKELIRAK